MPQGLAVLLPAISLLAVLAGSAWGATPIDFEAAGHGYSTRPLEQLEGGDSVDFCVVLSPREYGTSTSVPDPCPGREFTARVLIPSIDYVAEYPGIRYLSGVGEFTIYLDASTPADPEEFSGVGGVGAPPASFVDGRVLVVADHRVALVISPSAALGDFEMTVSPVCLDPNCEPLEDCPVGAWVPAFSGTLDFASASGGELPGETSFQVEGSLELAVFLGSPVAVDSSRWSSLKAGFHKPK